MTRLLTDDICKIVDTLPAYDRLLRERTGHNLRQLALRANGRHGHPDRVRFDEAPAVVVPMTSGHGVIHGFAEAVAGILRHIGFDAAVSDRPDVGGLTDACAGGARMVLTADDQTFSAINLATRQVADNSEATGRGFAAALESMAGAVDGRRALVLGCGPVGLSAARALARSGARVGLLDADMAKARALADALHRSRAIGIQVEDRLESALAAYDLLLDATPAADIIAAADIGPRTRVAAPGVPCGLTPDARAELASRWVHDPLQIGVAVMAVEAWLPPSGENAT